MNTGTANDLRNRRDALLNQLSELVEIRVQETKTGTINVSVGSDFLVEDTTSSDLIFDTRVDGSINLFDVRIEKSNKLLRTTGGRLQGILGSAILVAKSSFLTII